MQRIDRCDVFHSRHVADCSQMVLRFNEVRRVAGCGCALRLKWPRIISSRRAMRCDAPGAIRVQSRYSDFTNDRVQRVPRSLALKEEVVDQFVYDRPGGIDT